MDYENLIDALRLGNIPSENIEYFAVGRERELKEFDYILDKLEDTDNSETKFLRGDFGQGKSFLLKIIEEKAFKRNFVVSEVRLSPNIPISKIDVVYRHIASELRCKTGTSLSHIINKWITILKADANDEYPDDIQKQIRYVEDEMDDCLKETAEYSHSFATAIKNYYKLSNKGDNDSANYALAWIRGEENIPAAIKKRFGVKGGVEKDTAFDFLKALSVFIKSIGYSGLVILLDEAEATMNLIQSNSRNNAYKHIREICDQTSKNKFKSTLFVFAGTSRFFTDKNKGVPSYPALDDVISNPLSGGNSIKNPVISLSGLSSQNLDVLAKELINVHENAYNWNVGNVVYGTVQDIINIHIEQSSLLKGIVNPRLFIKSIVTCLDIIRENPNNFKDKDSIIQLFIDNETQMIDEDDW